MDILQHLIVYWDAVMLDIPAGSITLRDDRKKIIWSEELNSFELSSHPITQLEYQVFMGCTPATFNGANHPIESISWWNAIDFCNRLSAHFDFETCYEIDESRELATWNPKANGFRLPTDAEWEYACRAETGDVRYGPLEDIAWYAGNTFKEGTREVALKQPNSWGLHDMLGNVWEWCWDVYDAEFYGQYRVFRGGGWADAERGCLASNRRRSHPTYSIDDLGFRIARIP